jgi:mannosyltransferase OCH1-like enzyme
MLLLFHLNKSNETFNNIINNYIPKNIYICYKTKIIPKYIIPNIKKIYPDYNIKLYDDNDCIGFLKKEYDQEYVDVFNSLKDGPIKADFWRVCILYKYGGIYSDLDLEHIKNINDVIDKDTSFVTCITEKNYRKANPSMGMFNPCFILSKPNHKVLKQAIDVYLNYYRTNKPYNYFSYSITNILADILKKEININNDTKEGIYYDKDNNKYEFLSEMVPKNGKNGKNGKNWNSKKAYVEYNKQKLFNVRYKNYKFGSTEWRD